MRVWRGFWAWYERNYLLNVAIASALFVLQLVHLTWLGADPIAQRLANESFFSPEGLLRYLIYAVDYSEIPALVAVSLVYVNELRRTFAWKPLLYLLFLNSQWLHILWITDEYVASELAGPSLPAWLAWLAILIDYLELPVIFDTLKRLTLALRVSALSGRSDRRAVGSPDPVRTR
jgi:hypothetical protein